MAVYYKFTSAKDFDFVPVDTHFITVGHFKEKIFELKHLGGTDFDLIVINAQTIEEYLDEGMLIPRNTSVLIRRVPGPPQKPIITAPVIEKPNVGNTSDDAQAIKGSVVGADPSDIKYAEYLEWDDFVNDLYAIPESGPLQSSIPAQDAPPVNKEDEDSKIKALVDTPALDWQCQPSDGFGPGRGFRRGMGGRMIGGHGFGIGGFEKKTPPQGYICHRCKVPGHFIQHCPTNGDPDFDIKRVRPPTGIPKSMLMATPDGSYVLPNGDVAVLKPNEAAFEKEIEGMPSTCCSVGEIPPELHCPLCKQVMKDAVLTSKCCFTSFCDKCIRDYVTSKSNCVCGATSVLADDLLPNKTLRDTINRILESSNSSAENGGSAFQVRDDESRNLQAKVPSSTPAPSAALKRQQVPAAPPQVEETLNIAETVEEKVSSNLPLEQEKGRTLEEETSYVSAPSADGEVQPKPISSEAGKKKKKKKTNIRMPPGAADMQWISGEDLAAENFMMHPTAFIPYWNGIDPGLDGLFMTPYGGPIPYMGYGLPMDVAFGGVLPYNPFGGPGCMLPYGPLQRDLELGMGFNAGPPPPTMSRGKLETRNAELKREPGMERHAQRESSKDRDYGREGRSTVDVSSGSKSKSVLPHLSSKKKSHCEQEDRQQHHRDHHHHHRSHRRSESPSEPPLSSTDKSGVFSGINFPEKESKKRKLSSISSDLPPSSHRNGQYHEARHKAVTGSRKNDRDSSDDERHFKRRRSRYTS